MRRISGPDEVDVEALAVGPGRPGDNVAGLLVLGSAEGEVGVRDPGVGHDGIDAAVGAQRRRVAEEGGLRLPRGHVAVPVVLVPGGAGDGAQRSD